MKFKIKACTAKGRPPDETWFCVYYKDWWWREWEPYDNVACATYEDAIKHLEVIKKFRKE